MMRKIMTAGLLAAMLVACSASPNGGDPRDIDAAAAGAGSRLGATPVTANDDAESENASEALSGGLNETATDPGFGQAERADCREALAFQEAGGFWCEHDVAEGSAGAGALGEFGEETDPDACRWCYLARCGADGFLHWVPVECSSLPLT